MLDRFTKNVSSASTCVSPSTGTEIVCCSPAVPEKVPRGSRVSPSGRGAKNNRPVASTRPSFSMLMVTVLV